MKSRYAIQERKNHLLMQISGPYDYWEFIDYPEIILRQCEAAAIFRIIVDLKNVTFVELSTLELFFLGEKLAEKLRHRIKIAMVWNVRREGAFLEKVASNREVSIRVFESVAKAKLWLLFDHQDEPSNLLKY